MTYCTDCFSDDFLRDFAARKGVLNGECPSCGSVSPQVEADQLAPYFEQVADAYSIRPNIGRPLAELLQEHWQIFSPHLRDPPGLVREVLGIGAEVLFEAREAAGGIPLEHWDELRQEIKGVNRFFPEYSLSAELMRRVFDHLSIEVPRATFFRGRIVEPGGVYLMHELGAPPAFLAAAGRANPVGIPYLYLASDLETALCEIKPQKGAEAIVVGYEQVSSHSMRVVDFESPRSRVSPFKWGASIADLLSTLPLIEALGAELSIPVQAIGAAVDYLASQYICELIKKCGFAGVRYGSSLGPGANFAFFNPAAFEPIPPRRRFQISHVRIDSVDAGCLD